MYKWKIIIILILISVSLTGCIDKSENMQPELLLGDYLYVTEKTWYGPDSIWDVIFYKEKKTNSKFRIENEGQEIDLGKNFTSTKLKVLSFDSEKIKLLSEGADVKEGDTPGINLSNCGRQEFQVMKGQTFRLATCTMDAGRFWSVKYNS